MRTAFFSTLFEFARADRRITLVVADIGFGVVNSFTEHLPGQFVNVGVAEQDMIGIATGLALSGRIVFVYSIANFPTLRCLEQIRNDVCYHKANVKIISGGSGLSYGVLGMSHHMTEDIAVMRSMPNMTVIAPGDPVEAGEVVRALLNYTGPAYVRLGRAEDATVHRTRPAFEIGKAITLRQGNDATLISTGSQLFDTMGAADSLATIGINARVLSMHTIKPLDVDEIFAAARETNAIFTIEAHSVVGGLGGAVSELLMESTIRPIWFRRIGLQDAFVTDVGSEAYIKSKSKLDVAGIVDTVISTLYK